MHGKPMLCKPCAASRTVFSIVHDKVHMPPGGIGKAFIQVLFQTKVLKQPLNSVEG
jgi:hypothetical protein